MVLAEMTLIQIQTLWIAKMLWGFISGWNQMQGLSTGMMDRVLGTQKRRVTI